MTTEIEIKILDIDVEDILETLHTLWAKDRWVRDMRRYVYDFSPKKENSWVRLRDNWKEVSLAVKEITHDAIDGTKELEVVVSDFVMTHMLLEKLWYRAKAYQENRRHSFVLWDVMIEIDFRPMLHPYMEIEWPTKEAVYDVAEKLWFSSDRYTSKNTTQIYADNGIDLDGISDLRF